MRQLDAMIGEELSRLGLPAKQADRAAAAGLQKQNWSPRLSGARPPGWAMLVEAVRHWNEHRPPGARAIEMAVGDDVDLAFRMTITVQNDGPEVVSTDFFESDQARRGGVFLSLNAGAVRVFLPSGMGTDVLGETASATSASLTWLAVSRAYQLVFEDGTDRPFGIETNQFDRILPAAERGRRVECMFYVPGGSPSSVRRARELPGVFQGHVNA